MAEISKTFGCQLGYMEEVDFQSVSRERTMIEVSFRVVAQMGQ
jgi:hypothetical protein